MLLPTLVLHVLQATLKCTTEALQKSVPRALALAVAPCRPVPLTPRETGPPGPRVLRVLYMWLFAFLQLLAVELGVVSTRLTAADKAEHMKRLRHTSLLPFAPGRFLGGVLAVELLPGLHYSGVG